MFGKHFGSMYTGSLAGSGAVVFAVMGYVIANARPDKVVGGQVELNPLILGTMLGEPQERIEKAIEFLCSPDPKSRTKKLDGRRLVKLSEFDYQVVNFDKYRKIKDEETRREQNRQAQAKFRQVHGVGKREIGIKDMEDHCDRGIPLDGDTNT
jgi:hypothetical protein